MLTAALYPYLHGTSSLVPAPPFWSALTFHEIKPHAAEPNLSSDYLFLLQESSLSLRVLLYRAGVDLSPLADSRRELVQDGDGGFPVDAGICYANALLQARGTLGGHLLVSFVDVGLNHDADDGLLALSELVGDDFGDLGLVPVVLVRVAYGGLCVS